MLRILLLFLVSCPVMAMDGELSVGHTSFTGQQDGIWYQQPFAHDLNLSSTSFSLGGTGYIEPSLRYRFGYWHIGDASSSALAVASDAAYAKYGAQASQHYPLSHWYGSGSVNALYATIDPEYQVGPIVVAPEFGLTAYRATWTMNIPDWSPMVGMQYLGAPRPLAVQNKASIQGGLTYGISARYGSVSVALSVVSTRATGDCPAIYTGNATNLSVRYVF